MKNIVFALIAIGLCSPALATVDSHGQYYFAYETAQESAYVLEDSDMIDIYGGEINQKAFCLQPGIFFDGYSSSSVPTYEMMTKPVVVPAVGYFQQDVNDENGNGDTTDLIPQEMIQLNYLADEKLKLIVDWEKVDNWVKSNGHYDYEPEFTIDLSAFDLSTKQGRFLALTKAKVLIATLNYSIAMRVYNSQGMRPDYRMTINVVGGPSVSEQRAEFPVEPIYPSTNYPYSYGSPLAKKYFDEIVSSDFCSGVVKNIEAIYTDSRISNN